MNTIRTELSEVIRQETSLNIYKDEKVVAKFGLLRAIPESVTKAYADTILRLVPKGGSILEAGFGTGELLTALSMKINNVVGVDISEPMIQKTKQLFGETCPCTLIESNLFEYLRDRKEVFDVIHFKAILHCIEKPEELLSLMHSALKLGGYIITGHEESQIEARIEALYNIYPKVNDPDYEVAMGDYFEQRDMLAHLFHDSSKSFLRRTYPAGDSTNALNFFLRKYGYKHIERKENKDLSFIRNYTLKDFLETIYYGTFGVFRTGLTEEDRKTLYTKLKTFFNENRIDIQKERSTPAKLKILAAQKPS